MAKDQLDAEVGSQASGSASSLNRLPLFPSLQPAQPYPVECLGELMAGAAAGIADTVQVPIEIAAQSILATAALVAQGFSDVLLPFGQPRPLSLYLVTLADSGDRKSTSDNIACKAINDFESASGPSYSEKIAEWQCRCEAWKVQLSQIRGDKSIDLGVRLEGLRALGPMPQRPVAPILTPNDLTFEGLVNSWNGLPPSLGLLSPEGGQFTGGYSMKGDSRIRTAAGLSIFWDGKAYKQIRAGSGVKVISGRRLSIHLMVQPEVSVGFLNDEILLKQGLMSRLLIAAPSSIVGSRLYKPVPDHSLRSIADYQERIATLLKQSPANNSVAGSKLSLPALSMSDGARDIWIKFADWAEEKSAPGEEFHLIKDIAAKAAEQGARIAGVISIIADQNAGTISEERMQDALCLVFWYIYEALRLRQAYPVDPALVQAQNLLDWIASQPNQETTFVGVLQFGPGKTRTKREAELAIRRLAEHGLVVETSKRPRVIRATIGS